MSVLWTTTKSGIILPVKMQESPTGMLVPEQSDVAPVKLFGYPCVFGQMWQYAKAQPMPHQQPEPQDRLLGHCGMTLSRSN